MIAILGIAPVLVYGVAVGLGFIVTACFNRSSDSKRRADAGNAAGDASGVPAADASGGTGGLPDGATPVPSPDASNQPVPQPDAGPLVRRGINHGFSRPVYANGPVDVVDIDFSARDRNRILGIAASPVSRMFRIDVDPESPMQGGWASFGGRIPAVINGVGNVHPVQIVELSDGTIAVPFVAEGVVASGVALFRSFDDENPHVHLISGVSVSEGDGGTTSVNTSEISQAMLLGGRLHLVGVNGAADEDQDEQGIILSFERQASGALDFSGVHLPVALPGLYPLAAVPIGEMKLALHDVDDAGNSRMDLFDLGAGVGTSALQTTIPFARPLMAFLPEVAVTNNGRYAVVAERGPSSSMHVVLLVPSNPCVDPAITGSAGLRIKDYDPKDMVVAGNETAYIAVDGDWERDHIEEFDISDPAAPRWIRTLSDIDYNLGSMAIHGSGVIFVAVADAEHDIRRRIIAISPDEFNNLTPGTNPEVDNGLDAGN